MDTDVNDANDEKLQAEETDDSHIVDLTEVVPLTRDTDGSCTTECVDTDPFGEVRETDSADLKQEPDDVCCVLYPLFTLSQQREFVQMLGITSFLEVFLIQVAGSTDVQYVKPLSNLNALVATRNFAPAKSSNSQLTRVS